MKINEKLLPEKDYIIETGGNWNTNYYEKWKSGKLVQWGQSVFTDAITTANGSFYRPASNITKNLVTPFVNDQYAVQLTGLGGYVFVAYLADRYTNYFTYWPLATWSVNNSNNKYVHWIAIGRWK